MVKEFVIKILFIIFNIVMIIMVVLFLKIKEDEFKDIFKEMENFWGVKLIIDYNIWFFGVDMVIEVMESFKDIEYLLIEENCGVVVEFI